MSEAFEVDTHQIRETANSIKRVANQIKSLADSELTSMLSLVNDELRGDAANAMEDTLSDLKQDVRKIAGSLTTIEKSLLRYVAELERFDDEMAARIGG